MIRRAIIFRLDLYWRNAMRTMRRSVAIAVVLLAWASSESGAQSSAYFGRVGTSRTGAPTVRSSQVGASARKPAQVSGRPGVGASARRTYTSGQLGASGAPMSTPRDSTSRRGPAPVPQTRAVPSQPRSSTYFPGMRPARAAQRPVTYRSQRYSGAGCMAGASGPANVPAHPRR